MNPIIHYKDYPTPFGIEIPLVQKRLSKNSTRNFMNKEEFVNQIESIKPSRRVDSYVIITCSCGKSYNYKNSSEIPSDNLICDCKRKLIEYG